MPVVRSFRDLLENQCYDEIYESINEFVQDNPGSLDCSTRCVQSPDEATLSDLHIRLASIVDSPEEDISFYAIVEAELEIAETIQRNREIDEVTQWFKVRCTATLDNGLHNLNTEEVSLYTKYDKAQKKCLSDALVPIIYKEELDEVAEDFLSRYYSETLEKPMPIDPVELAKRMGGLTIVQAHLSKSCTIFGQTCFSDGEIKYYDLEERKFKPLGVRNGTILIDPDVFFMRNIGSVNNTIVHECVHWDKHRKFFELEKLYNPEASAIRCQVMEGTNRDKEKKTEYEWMEWHASSLAPRILMPAKTTLQKTKELIEKNRKLLPSANKTDILESVIFELSDFFGVSKLAAKIRLIDLGFQEAIGVLTYVDERYISNYAFEEGALKRGQTYTIGALDALIESRPGTKFRELLQSGQFLYVDAHFCINDPKYIIEDEYGFAHLTDYALMHIDECCLAFCYCMKVLDEWLAEGKTFILCFIDINNLKYVNDRFGHTEGDRYIVCVSNILCEFSEEAIVCRIGGDEFMLLIQNWSLDAVQGRLEVLQNQLAGFNRHPSTSYDHSMSYGAIAVGSDNTLLANDLLNAADEKMYEYKRAYKKRNRNKSL